MTAIDYLTKELNIINDMNDVNDQLKQTLITAAVSVAKSKEKNQIEEAYRFGKMNCFQVANDGMKNVTATEYYDDKYNEI
jgi:hypothetical protein